MQHVSSTARTPTATSNTANSTTITKNAIKNNNVSTCATAAAMVAHCLFIHWLDKDSVRDDRAFAIHCAFLDSLQLWQWHGLFVHSHIQIEMSEFRRSEQPRTLTPTGSKQGTHGCSMAALYIHTANTNDNNNNNSDDTNTNNDDNNHNNNNKPNTHRHHCPDVFVFACLLSVLRSLM
jgi:hypothetical protein